MNFATEGKTPTTEATKQAIKEQLENAEPTLKTSDYYTLYLGHSYKMPKQRTFMTLDFWISFIGEKEAKEHLEIMKKTNQAFKDSYPLYIENLVPHLKAQKNKK